MRENWIDGIKGISILGIVMCHIGGVELPEYLGLMRSIGAKGTQMFFVIAVFFAFVSYEKNISCNSPKSDIDWIFSRFIRLVPLYYLSVIVSLICFHNEIFSDAGILDRTLNIITHLSFLHGLSPQHCNSIIGVEWYLGALSIYYVLVPVLYRKIKTIEDALAIFIISTFTCYTVAALILKILSGLDSGKEYVDFFGNYCFVNQIPTAILGIVFFRYIHLDNRRACQKRLSYILLIFALVILWGIPMNKCRLFCISEVTLYGLCFFVILVSQVLYQNKTINNTIFVFFGKYSYAIYLSHYIIIRVFNQLIPVDKINSIGCWTAKYAIVLLLSTIISVPLTKYVEKPICGAIARKMISGGSKKRL